MILLDTNAWSILSKPNADPRAIRWMDANGEHSWLSTIVIAEIRAGIENPDAAHRRAELTRWLNDLEERCRDRILAFETDAAHIFGELIAKRKLLKQQTKLLDAQIAAQGIAHGCPVATGNTRDFEWTGVQLIDPWAI